MDWERQYRKQCYDPIMHRYMEGFLENVADHAKEVHEELTGQADAFFQSLCLLQEHKKLGPVRTISISFPYTLLEIGTPGLLFEVYPGTVPFLEPAEVSQECPVSWLFSSWEDMLHELKAEAGKQGLGAIIRMPYIRSQAWGGARLLLSMVSVIVKYHLYGLEEMKSFQELEKAEECSLSFGEYMDWQRPIWKQRSEVDIFFCEKETDLRFRVFQKVWYEEKEFKNLTLDDCRFEECMFQNCHFIGTSFRDARLSGCMFRECTFDGVLLNGARFDGCSLEQVHMKGIHTNSFSEDRTAIGEMQGMTEWISCFLSEVTIAHSDFSASYFRSCRQEKVHTEDSRMPESFYAGQAGQERGNGGLS